MEIILIVVGVLILAGIGLVFWKLNSSGENGNLLNELKQDRETRFREAESLRNEMRESSKILREQFDRVNKTVDTKLSDSSKQLNERLDKSSNVIGNLQKELGKMGEIGSKIENLDKILRAPKGRGGMGEESLEEILRSVFPANLWERQFNLGTGLVVDAVVKTSSGIIPIDAKFPLPAFERIVQAENDDALEKAQKEFQKDMKLRIDEVAKYIRPEKETMDFAILFLPNENVYYEAAIRSGEISEYTKKKKVLLTGPNTMLYVLQMLFQAYQSQEFAREAQHALAELSGVKKQAERLDEEIGVLAKHIGNANSKVSDVQGENMKLQNQVERAQALESDLTQPQQDKLL
jgi:DNA recombination protein RmuC